jgi:hypothetical protein
VPLHPDRVTPELLESGLVRYTYRAPKGGTQTLMQNEVHYRRGRSLDGVSGLADHVRECVRSASRSPANVSRDSSSTAPGPRRTR